VILDDLPARREMPTARVTALRHAIERAARGRRPAHRKAWFLVPAGAAACALAVVLVANTLTPTAAYASWTAVPGTLTSAETTALGAQCATSVRASFPNAADDLKPVVGERRGTFQTALIAGGPQIALCADWLGVPDGEGVRGSSLSGLVLDAALKQGEVLQTIAVPGQLSGPDAARIAFGLVSSDVRAVKVITAEGVEVTASVQRGYFLAWWPSGSSAASVKAFAADGQLLAEQNNP
jgi:hypothetical protein